MSGTADELAPMYVGSEALSLSLADPLATLRAFSPIEVAVDYSGAGDGGVALPLEMLVTGPSSTSFVRKVFWRTTPSLLTFTPQEGGNFLVLLREVGHNKLRGKLAIVVEGERTG
jgi:hypothetical protein